MSIGILIGITLKFGLIWEEIGMYPQTWHASFFSGPSSIFNELL